MKSIFINIGICILSSSMLAILAICCTPYLIFTCIRDAYQDDRDNSRMHRSIEQFLNSQRDKDDYQQIHAW